MLINLISDLNILGLVSFVTTFLFIIIIFCSIVIGFYSIDKNESDLQPMVYKTNSSNIFLYIIEAYFAADGLALVIPVRASIHNQKDFLKLYFAGTLFVFWVYFVFGNFAYLVN